MASAIELVDIHKKYRLTHGRANSLKSAILSFRRPRSEELWVLRGITFSVDPGETVAVIGRNGAGKSTLLGLLGNIYKPTSGKLAVRGRVSSLLHLGAGFHPELTGIENIYLNGAILGLRTREIKSKLDSIIEFAEMDRFIDAPLKTYSDGMVMRLGFSVAVEVNPDILLVDEVLAVGDQAFQQKCYNRIADFQSKGKTILFVSHDLEAVKKAASRTIWISDGLVKMDGATSKVLEAYLDEMSGGIGGG